MGTNKHDPKSCAAVVTHAIIEHDQKSWEEETAEYDAALAKGEAQAEPLRPAPKPPAARTILSKDGYETFRAICIEKARCISDDPMFYTTPQ